MKDLAKVKSLLQEAMAAVEACEGMKMEDDGEEMSAAPEGDDEEEDELPMKSMKMKLSKYKV